LEAFYYFKELLIEVNAGHAPLWFGG